MEDAILDGEVHRNGESNYYYAGYEFINDVDETNIQLSKSVLLSRICKFLEEEDFIRAEIRYICRPKIRKEPSFLQTYESLVKSSIGFSIQLERKHNE